jgi:hypothetical protein
MLEAPKKPASIWISIAPALVVLLVAMLIVLAAVWQANGDPMALVRIGTRFSEGDPDGSEGYDGQFVYYIAVDPNPWRVARQLDVPAYRYQRILLPLFARLFSFGNPTVLPFLLILIGIVSLVVGTWAVSELLAGWGVNRWYALIYGFWAGFLLALMVDLPEPLAYGLVVLGFLALERKKKLPGWILLGLSPFAKEVTLVFLAALLISYIIERKWVDTVCLALVGLVPYALFQTWLWYAFGAPGIGSGGGMATPFEIIPFMGFLRIGAESLTYLIAMGVVFIPMLIIPSIWGIAKSI